MQAGPQLSQVVGWFKTMTTNDYMRGVRSGDFPAFDRRLWQRDYYDHIIRGDASLERIRQYIVNNPARWAEDEENPNRVSSRPSHSSVPVC
jgi:REP element-mobilizing transposase RayT